MARAHKYLNVVFDLVVGTNSRGENIFKKATIRDVNPSLTDEQLKLVTTKISNLLQDPVAEVVIVTHESLLH